MPRTTTNTTPEKHLPLDLITTAVHHADDAHRPRPLSSPIALEGIDLSSIEGGIGGLSHYNALASSPPRSARHTRDTSKNSITGVMAGRDRDQSADRLREQQNPRGQGQSVREGEEYRPGSSSMSKVYHLRKAPGSTPELSLVGSAESVAKDGHNGPNAEHPQRPQPSPHHSEDSTTSRKKDKPFRNPLTRTKSIRRDSHSKQQKPTGLNPPSFDQPPNTAPLNAEWSNSNMSFLKESSRDKRGKSAERAVRSADSNENLTTSHAHPKEKNAFMSGSKNVLGKAKTGGGNFFTRLGKMTRSGSSSEKEIPDAEYQLKVIKLPLVEQTRISRISKKIENSKDKTEYWMPSLPWRCIDFLNLNCESQGLYRVPGSGPQVKHWQRRFDQELDVDLLDETELYDPNTIGSMLKSWFRDLPTDIVPQELQVSLAAELQQDNPEFSHMGQQAPQKLRDALSELPPFNYYLLFAITCHLSLLLSHKDRNQMGIENLAICFLPCLRMDKWLFNYLVGDWRHCWQGCWTEKQYLEEEKLFEDPNYVPGSLDSAMSAMDLRSDLHAHDVDERAVSSGGDSAFSGFTPAENVTTPVPPADSRNNSFTPSEPRRSHDSRAQQQSSRSKDTSRPRASRENSHESTSRMTNGRHRENSKPTVYVPVGMQQSHMNGMPNGRNAMAQALAQAQDIRRPSTAENRAANGRDTSVPATTTPRPRGHGRSQSDLPVTPSQAGFPSDPFGGERR